MEVGSHDLHMASHDLSQPQVNMSPNLSSGHTHGNRFMYEQVLFNLLSLVGAIRKGGPGTQYK